ncbi:ATP-grasp domain-containing protein [Streptomyces bambusae]|uniref:Alpha-L-glutamate ligase n=1 Tax=Streptomyces bambusae TaxID=1550616 RepID=A0ABS6Z2Q7_9ACTN|nr:alpha-L-glutamate ligase [Streptomyces bambusae]MBW5481689.1 alpha-L-glutamate ligase [Streptomyces bambusae]
MRIGLITPRPDHPVLAATSALLARGGHEVLPLDPDRLTRVPLPPADVYLLKSGAPRALALARDAERNGVPVVNSAAATELCQDRTAMADTALAAGLPFAATRTFDALRDLVASSGPALRGPVVVKSRHNRKQDVVARVDDDAALRALAAAHPGEPVVVQEFAPNNGWDHKLWAVGDRLFAALRRSELAPGQGPSTRPLAVADLPPGWAALVHRVGEVFALDVFGVDLIDTGAGTPLIVDVNAFPGIRDQAGAPEALAALALRHAAGAADVPGTPAVPGTPGVSKTAGVAVSQG